MREVGVLEAKTHLSSLLDLVEGGEEIVITRHGKPVARMAPAVSGQRAASSFASEVRSIRDQVAAEWRGDSDFDWKAAVEEGRK
jgi:prevent-host-death family protein